LRLVLKLELPAVNGDSQLLGKAHTLLHLLLVQLFGVEMEPVSAFLLRAVQRAIR